MSHKTKSVGRPPEYGLDVYKEIFEIISTTKKGVKEICDENEKFPSYSTVRDAIKENPELSDLYARAKKDQLALYGDELIKISDDTSIDVQRAKVMIDTRKWLLVKLMPKTYGEKIEVTDSTTNYDERNKSTEELSERINAIFNKGGSSEPVEAGSDGTELNSTAD